MVGDVVVVGRLVLEALVEREEEDAIVLVGRLVLALVVCEVEELWVVVELLAGGWTVELLDLELELDDDWEELREEDVDLEDTELLDLEPILDDREELSEEVVD